MKAFYALCVLGVSAMVCAAGDQAAIPQPGTIVCDIPIEQVVREGKYMVAKEVTGKITVTIDGHIYTGTLTFPDTKVRRTGVGRMEVDACQAKGKLR
jgi:uncharacterized protein YdeI (BOF family)